MKRLLKIVLPLLFVGGGGWFLKSYPIDGLPKFNLTLAAGTKSPFFSDAPGEGARDKIRVASFNIQVFGESKLDKPQVVEILCRIVRQFDVVAIQEVRARTQDVLPRFVAMINSTGAQYDYAIGPRLGRTSSKEQYAFVYNTATIELDRASLYTVDDPDDLLHREPFVAGFRARAVPPGEAFTFTLIDIHTDPDEVKSEVNVLDDVFRAVRNDGRQEDDIILLGDFNADEHHLGELGQLSYIQLALSGVTSNTHGTHLFDNLLFDQRATTEFTGEVGVLDMLRQFNLTMEEALEVSDHCPVWAVFDVREGGKPGAVAAQPTTLR